MLELKKVIFFSGYQPEHFGDLHLSKEYIRNIAIQLKKYGVDSVHLSGSDPHVVNIKDMESDHLKNYRYLFNGDQFVDLCQNPPSFFHEESGFLYLNSWVGHFGIVGGKYSFHNFASQMDMWKTICEAIELNFGFKITMTDDAFDYVSKIDEELLNDYEIPEGNKIFVANSTPLSGQSQMGNLKNTVDYLSDKYPNNIFICTEKLDLSKSNIYYTDDLTKRNEMNYNSLPEVTKISEACALMITNCSGPGTFLFTKNNLSDKNKTIICFVDSENCPTWSGLNNVFSKNIWSPEHKEEEICKIIEKEIIEKYGEFND